jgi:hypothetical protein
MVAISAPQHIIERVPSGADAITIIAIRKIIEGGIDGEPVPYTNAVNDLGFRQPALLYQLQELRA